MSKWFAVIGFCLVGCSAPPIYMRGYSGDTLPKDEVSLVKPSAYLTISRIDSMTGLNIFPSGPGLSTIEYEIELPSGRHYFEISFNSGTAYSFEKLPFTVYLQPNRRYIIRPVINERRWKPELVDVTNKKPECWTMGIGILTRPRGCE